MSTVNGFQVGSDVLKYNYEALENYNTPNYSSSSTYDVGDYVMYQGKLYKCKTAIGTAEVWTSAHWDLAVMSEDLTELNENAVLVSTTQPSSSYNHIWVNPSDNEVEIPTMDEFDELKSAISETTDNIWANQYYYSGTGDNNSGVWYIESPTTFVAGTYTLSFLIQSTDTNASVCQVAVYDTSGSYTSSHRLYNTTVVRNNRTYITFTTAVSFSHFIFMASGNASNSAGDTLTVYDIKLETGSTPTPFLPKTIGVDQYARQYQQLEATGDGRNRAGEIKIFLDTYGVCNLGKGTFYVSKIEMPDYTTLRGVGELTQLVLISGETTEAVNMGAGCTVSDLSIIGASSDITPDGTIGTRNGIAWNKATNTCGTVHNVRIKRFNGAGIIMQDTTQDIQRGLKITDCYITNCNVGIFVRKDSEFNTISTCTVTGNYYGYYCRGGNNYLDNSNLDSNIYNLYFDAAEGSNTGHGSVCNCSVNHANNNTGYGLTIYGTGRMLISNCAFYYSKIRLESTNGNVLSGCGFNNTGIEIVNGTCNIIADCMAKSTDDTTITVTNNTLTKIDNCWTRDGTALTV